MAEHKDFIRTELDIKNVWNKNFHESNINSNSNSNSNSNISEVREFVFLHIVSPKYICGCCAAILGDAIGDSNRQNITTSHDSVRDL